ncbi:hypothetical protein TNCT_196681 [Trichonephila clavata]|uniref:Uncharacterized protein n=1 Tax=Trichonephila clavata TaxID=2740835 RepID=A0A8X6KQM6_TRICU|nr:hypothetical protein TNCT_196681 [Trichonephila clavata]
MNFRIVKIDIGSAIGVTAILQKVKNLYLKGPEMAWSVVALPITSQTIFNGYFPVTLLVTLYDDCLLPLNKMQLCVDRSCRTNKLIDSQMVAKRAADLFTNCHKEPVSHGVRSTTIGKISEESKFST